MFEKKQVIYSETLGVCRVENIVPLSAARGESVPYYVLRSVFDKEKVAYIPVDHHQVLLRELFDEQEARELEQDKGALEKDEKLREAVNYVLHREE